MERTVRLGQLARQINVGVFTISEFLYSKGIEAEANPNTKISEYEMMLVEKEFFPTCNLINGRLVKSGFSLKQDKRVTLGQVARQINVSISTITQYLTENGVDIEASPNTRLDDDAINLITEEYISSAYSSKGSSYFKTVEKISGSPPEIQRRSSQVSFEKLILIGNLGKPNAEFESIFSSIDLFLSNIEVKDRSEQDSEHELIRPSKRQFKVFLRYIRTGKKLNGPKLRIPSYISFKSIDHIITPYTFYTFPEEDAALRLCKVSVSLNSM